MSCWCHTRVLRIPASALGFVTRRQWDAFLQLHERDFDWRPGCFAPSLCDAYPYSLGWDEADFENPDWRLARRDPRHPDVVPGPFLDYYLAETEGVSPDGGPRGESGASILEDGGRARYLPLFRRLFPHFTAEDMRAVRCCDYIWYNGSNAPYFYSVWSCGDE